MIYQEFTVDTQRGSYTHVITKQYDSSSRVLRITIRDNGQVFSLAKRSAKLCIQRPGGYISFLPGTIKNEASGIVDFTLTMETLGKAGELAAEIMIYSTSNDLLTSIPFIIQNYVSLHNDSIIESSNEFTALTEALSRTTNSLLNEPNSIPSSLLKTTTNADKIQISNLSSEILSAMRYSSPPNKTLFTGMISQEGQSVIIPKLNDYERYRMTVYDMKNFVHWWTMLSADRYKEALRGNGSFVSEAGNLHALNVAFKIDSTNPNKIIFERGSYMRHYPSGTHGERYQLAVTGIYGII